MHLTTLLDGVGVDLARIADLVGAGDPAQVTDVERPFGATLVSGPLHFVVKSLSHRLM